MQFKVKGILSFPHLFQPRAIDQNSEAKYSVQVLLRKDDPQVQTVQQAVETEKANGFPSGFPANARSCLKDGAVEFPDDPRLHNFMIVSANAKADQKPHVVDASLNPVMDPAQVYPGCVAWVALNTFSYNQVAKGVSCGINGVMLTGEEGELGRLDNKPSAEQMFADVAGAAPPQQPGNGGPPPAPQAPGQAAPPPAPQPPPTPEPPQAPPQPQFQMTDKANGLTREQYHQAGWTDDMLIQHGYMVSPTGQAPSWS